MADEITPTPPDETPADAPVVEPAPPRRSSRRPSSTAAASEAITPPDPGLEHPVAEPIPAPDDTPPKRTRRRRSDAGKSRKDRTPRAPRTPAALSGAAVRKRLGELANLVGGLVALVEPHDGAVITANADILANGWAPVVERHPRLKNALVGLEAGGIYGACAVATLTVAIPILARHRLLPLPAAQLAGLAGIPMPPVSAAPAGTDQPPVRPVAPVRPSHPLGGTPPPADVHAAPAGRHPLSGHAGGAGNGAA